MIRMLAAIVLISAYFNTSTTAIIAWEQPPDPPGLTITCLVRYYGAEWPAGICWHDLEGGVQTVELPGELSHPAYRPAHGDTYELRINGELVATATLGESVVYKTYVALTRAGVQRSTVYLPALLR